MDLVCIKQTVASSNDHVQGVTCTGVLAQLRTEFVVFLHCFSYSNMFFLKFYLDYLNSMFRKEA